MKAMRRRRTSRRSTRRRRVSRRRRSLRVRPDGIVKEKITFTVKVTNTNATLGYYNIHWHNDIPGAPAGNCGFRSQSSQFNDMQRNYQFYYLYGLSIKYHPRVFGQSAGNQAYISYYEVATLKTDTTLAFDETACINAPGYALKDPNQILNRYYRVGKYMKGIKWGWMEEGNLLDNSLRMTTGIRVVGGNFGEQLASDLGRI